MDFSKLDSKKLNENQSRAVQWKKDSPLLVLAGPGSGKTLVLTQRVASLIKEEPEASFCVLGLTFTTKAADEMRKRVEKYLGPESSRARLTTFHSFCAEVLRQHGSHLGLRPDFKILNQEADRLLVLNEAIQKVSLDPSYNLPGNGQTELVKVMNMVDYLLREGDDVESQSQNQGQAQSHGDMADLSLPFHDSSKKLIPQIYKSYIDTLIQKNHLDFGTLLVCCLRLFRSVPRIAKLYCTIYPYVCVDEYQDTNKVQDDLIRYLSPPKQKNNLFVVADDDQIIYQWNGASPERLEKLKRDYNMEVIQLPESFRCPAQIVEIANKLISHNGRRSPHKQPLTSAQPQPTQRDRGKGVVKCFSFSDQDEEMQWIATNIADQIKKNIFQPKDCVILTRNKKLLNFASATLKAQGLFPHLVVRKDEFQSAPLRFVHSALRLENAPQNKDQLQRLCKAFHDLSGRNIQVERVNAKSAFLAESTSLHEGALLKDFLDLAKASVTDKTRFLLKTLQEDLIDWRQYDKFSKAVLDWASKERRKERDATNGAMNELDEEIEVWNSLKDEIYRDAGQNPPPLGEFLQKLDLRSKVPEPRPNHILCLTVHLAKGREFHHVYLAGLAEDQLPSYYAIKKGDKSREMEEERRNCFVAITRVQSSLTLTCSNKYYGWRKSPSRFLTEMGIQVPAFIQPAVI